MHCRGKTSHPYKVLFIPEGSSREHHAGNLNKDLPTMISKWINSNAWFMNPTVNSVVSRYKLVN